MRLIAGEQTVKFKDVQKIVKAKLKEGNNVEVKYSKYHDDVVIVWGE